MVYCIGHSNVSYNTVLGALALGEGKRGGDSSDNIQIGSYHMATAGTVSSSCSSNRRKANSDEQQRRATSAATA